MLYFDPKPTKQKPSQVVTNHRHLSQTRPGTDLEELVLKKTGSTQTQQQRLMLKSPKLHSQEGANKKILLKGKNDMTQTRQKDFVRTSIDPC